MYIFFFYLFLRLTVFSKQLERVLLKQASTKRSDSTDEVGIFR